MKDVDIDDPSTDLIRRRIVRGKPFLRQIYAEWYARIAKSLPPVEGPILEIGSGPGLSSEFIPDVLQSDLMYQSWLNLIADGIRIPLKAGRLRAILIVNVLHHIPQPEHFLSEAARCLREGGALLMLEPWNTPWSKFVYRNFHHEAFDTSQEEWGFASSGPMTGANGALPWIIFERDKRTFLTRYPSLEIKAIDLLMPFRYVLSGGYTMRSLMPTWTYPGWRFLEASLQPFINLLAMFAAITVRKVAD